MINASWRAYENSGVFQEKVRLQTKNGHILACTCTNVALFDEHSRIKGILCILHDKSNEEVRKAELKRLVGEVANISARLESIAANLTDVREAPRLSARGLTNRHIEVTRLAVSGASTKVIAAELGLAEATVKSHLSTVYRKLGVKSRAELIRITQDLNFKFE